MPAVADSTANDNHRVKRYIINHDQPALAHGVSTTSVSIEVGKLADLVLWRPAFFGVKPSLILKGRFIAAAAMGDPNASIPTPQPVHYRPMFGSLRRRAEMRGRSASSQAALHNAAVAGWRCSARWCGARLLQRAKADMVLNRYAPRSIVAETYVVRADGELLACEPATELPMAQRYFLF